MRRQIRASQRRKFEFSCYLAGQQAHLGGGIVVRNVEPQACGASKQPAAVRHLWLPGGMDSGHTGAPCCTTGRQRHAAALCRGNKIGTCGHAASCLCLPQLCADVNNHPLRSPSRMERHPRLPKASTSPAPSTHRATPRWACPRAWRRGSRAQSRIRGRTGRTAEWAGHGARRRQNVGY